MSIKAIFSKAEEFYYLQRASSNYNASIECWTKSTVHTLPPKNGAIRFDDVYDDQGRS